MSEYTPTTENVRSVFAHSGAGQTTERRRAMFDRWLAAHDAEVRAGVVVEEQEWEWIYGVKWPGGLLDTPYDNEDEAREDAEGVGGSTFRRRAPGPWVPLEN